MAHDIERHLATLESALVGLLTRLQREERCMTPRERQRYSIGVRMLARNSGQTISEVITSLNRQAASGDSAAVAGPVQQAPTAAPLLSS